MNLTPERKLTTLLFNPFIYIAGGKALGLGLAAVLLAGLVGSLSNTHFDGVLDTHGGFHVPLGIFLAEGLADWLCLALVLLIFGKIISNTAFRTIDLFGTQALARWPTLLTSLVSLPPSMGRFGRELVRQLTTPGVTPAINTLDAVVFFTAVILMLLFLAWTVTLMYRSYSVSCNVKGARAVGTFIVGMLLAETLSKFAIYALLQLVVPAIGRR
jgi:hypothetical protein